MFHKIVFYEFIYGLYLIGTILGYPLLMVVAVVHGICKYLQLCLRKKSIKGQVALVTGSGRGLGKLLTIELARRGCHLAIVDIQGHLAQETAEFIRNSYDVKTKAYQIDVTNFQQLEELKTQITNDLGDVTILINNAGILTLSDLHNPPAHEVQRMINVNFTSVVYTTQLFLPRMKELNRGHIVNISSITAIVPLPMYTLYAATKAAIRQLTASLRIELMQQNYNIQATTVMPTFLNTNPRIVQLLQLVDGHRFSPSLDGDLAVQYIVRAMLNGDDELTVPRTVIHFYKLSELLPAYVREKVAAIFSKASQEKACKETYRRLLKKSDT